MRALPWRPLVELPESLNPFSQDGVRIYAKLMATHPANNVKAEMAVESELYSTIVLVFPETTPESSMFITDLSVSDTSEARLRLMQFFGLDLTLFGGPSQPLPYDGRGGIQRVYASTYHVDLRQLHENLRACPAYMSAPVLVILILV
jgi:hypothetical protein